MRRVALDRKLADLPAFPDSPAVARSYLDITNSVLQRQSSVLSELRSRASIVLSATGIIASLLGSEGLKHPHPTLAVVGALGCLAGGIMLCVAVLWPVSDKGELGERRQWQVTPSTDQTARLALVIANPSLPVPADLLRTFVAARLVNYSTISRRTVCFNLACLLLLGQLGAWAVVFLT